MLERLERIIIPTHLIDSLDSQEPPSGQRNKGHKNRRNISGAFASAVLIAACSSTPSTEPTTTNQGGNTEDNQGATNLILPFEGTWYLTSGPHFDGLSNGIRYALDFAPKEIVNCPGGAPLTNEIVIASESGKVTVVGNENDATDPNHSVVEITNNQGLTIGSMHLDNIRVKVGQDVKAGDPLGNPSCEISPGGDTKGIHLHEFLQKNGQPVSITGTIFSGFKVGEYSDNYQGTMINGTQLKTADVKRCDTDSACGGIRNDLLGSPLKDVLGAETTPPPNPETLPPQVSGEDLFRQLLVTLVQPNELPTGMITRGNSAGNLDATMQALGSFGQVNIAIEDDNSTVARGLVNGTISYNVFPDSSSAESAYKLIVAQTINNVTLEYSGYTITIGIFPNVIYQVLASSLIGDVVSVASLSGTDRNAIATSIAELAKASIDHLGNIEK